MTTPTTTQNNEILIQQPEEFGLQAREHYANQVENPNESLAPTETRRRGQNKITEWWSNVPQKTKTMIIVGAGAAVLGTVLIMALRRNKDSSENGGFLQSILGKKTWLAIVGALGIGGLAYWKGGEILEQLRNGIMPNFDFHGASMKSVYEGIIEDPSRYQAFLETMNMDDMNPAQKLALRAMRLPGADASDEEIRSWAQNQLDKIEEREDAEEELDELRDEADPELNDENSWTVEQLEVATSREVKNFSREGVQWAKDNSPWFGVAAAFEGPRSVFTGLAAGSFSMLTAVLPSSALGASVQFAAISSAVAVFKSDEFQGKRIPKTEEGFKAWVLEQDSIPPDQKRILVENAGDIVDFYAGRLSLSEILNPVLERSKTFGELILEKIEELLDPEPEAKIVRANLNGLSAFETRLKGQFQFLPDGSYNGRFDHLAPIVAVISDIRGRMTNNPKENYNFEPSEIEKIKAAVNSVIQTHEYDFEFEIGVTEDGRIGYRFSNQAEGGYEHFLGIDPGLDLSDAERKASAFRNHTINGAWEHFVETGTVVIKSGTEGATETLSDLAAVGAAILRGEIGLAVRNGYACVTDGVSNTVLGPIEAVWDKLMLGDDVQFTEVVAAYSGGAGVYYVLSFAKNNHLKVWNLFNPMAHGKALYKGATYPLQVAQKMFRLGHNIASFRYSAEAFFNYVRSIGRSGTAYEKAARLFKAMSLLHEARVRSVELGVNRAARNTMINQIVDLLEKAGYSRDDAIKAVGNLNKGSVRALLADLSTRIDALSKKIQFPKVFQFFRNLLRGGSSPTPTAPRPAAPNGPSRPTAPPGGSPANPTSPSGSRPNHPYRPSSAPPAPPSGTSTAPRPRPSMSNLPYLNGADDTLDEAGRAVAEVSEEGAERVRGLQSLLEKIKGLTPEKAREVLEKAARNPGVVRLVGNMAALGLHAAAPIALIYDMYVLERDAKDTVKTHVGVLAAFQAGRLAYGSTVTKPSVFKISRALLVGVGTFFGIEMSSLDSWIEDTFFQAGEFNTAVWNEGDDFLLALESFLANRALLQRQFARSFYGQIGKLATPAFRGVARVTGARWGAELVGRGLAPVMRTLNQKLIQKVGKTMIGRLIKALGKRAAIAVGGKAAVAAGAAAVPVAGWIVSGALLAWTAYDGYQIYRMIDKARRVSGAFDEQSRKNVASVTMPPEHEDLIADRVNANLGPGELPYEERTDEEQMIAQVENFESIARCNITIKRDDGSSETYHYSAGEPRYVKIITATETLELDKDELEAAENWEPGEFTPEPINYGIGDEALKQYYNLQILKLKDSQKWSQLMIDPQSGSEVVVERGDYTHDKFTIKREGERWTIHSQKTGVQLPGEYGFHDAVAMCSLNMYSISKLLEFVEENEDNSWRSEDKTRSPFYFDGDEMRYSKDDAWDRAIFSEKWMQFYQNTLGLTMDKMDDSLDAYFRAITEKELPQLIGD